MESLAEPQASVPLVLDGLLRQVTGNIESEGRRGGGEDYIYIYMYIYICIYIYLYIYICREPEASVPLVLDGLLRQVYIYYESIHR